MINGSTTLIAHLGFPTEHFKAPMIYNPWFEMKGINAVVVPMGVDPEHFPQVLRSLFEIQKHPWRAGHDAAQGDDDSARG
jgi:shikimate dehydrogenase